MGIEEMVKLAEEIAALFPVEGKNVSDSLELLSMYLDEIAEAAIPLSSQQLKERKYQENRALSTLLERLTDFQAQISMLTAHLVSDDAAVEVEETEKPEDVESVNRDLPNYAEYAVDDQAPHTLNEDFTHTKVSAVSICGMRYPVRNWQDALITTCDVLAATDREKLCGFLDDPAFQRRVNATFSRKETVGKTTKMRSMDIYVWTNISANQAKCDIRRLLMKYGISVADYAVFLRADYSPLHASYIKEHDDTDEPVDQEEKIGAFVRHTMRKLSADNTVLTPEQLTLMQQEAWSYTTLGLTKPFLKKLESGIPAFKQTKDEKGHSRYWNEVFKFNNDEYLINSQWFEPKRSHFMKWLISLGEDVRP